jgi:hypothetical protein
MGKSKGGKEECLSVRLGYGRSVGPDATCKKRAHPIVHLGVTRP